MDAIQRETFKSLDADEKLMVLFDLHNALHDKIDRRKHINTAVAGTTGLLGGITAGSVQWLKTFFTTILILGLVLLPSLTLGADFGPVWEKTILPHEGGFTANRYDPGNWTGGKVGKGKLLGTKYGIAASVYGLELLKKGIAIHSLTKEQARAIYERDYWRAFSFHMLASQGIARELCDETVNMGSAGSERLLRQVFAEIAWATGRPVPVRPQFYPETIQWINAYTKDRANRIAFYNSIRMKRVGFYVSLVKHRPAMRPFFLSWIDRSVDE